MARRRAEANEVHLALAPQPPRLTFTGHQTFSFRYAWLSKGVLAVKEDAKVFFRDDALVKLGVGKNMVDSIRHWCESLDLITVDGRVGHASLQPLARLLFGKDRREKGEDPYLEDPGTLWLLHWQLTSRPELASTWHFAFTRWNQGAFTRDELAQWILQLAKQSTAIKSSPASIRRDIDVFLRTYIPAEHDRRRPLEDTFDCPLGELGLIREVDRGIYEFRQGSKPSLPIEILAFALTQFWAWAAPNQRTLNVERLLFDPGSPGAAFKLSDRALVTMLEQLPANAGMRYDETAGLRVLQRTSEEPVSDSMTLLTSYYKGTRSVS